MVLQHYIYLLHLRTADQPLYSADTNKGVAIQQLWYGDNVAFRDWRLANTGNTM